MDILKVKNVSKIYSYRSKKVLAVDNISFEVKRGEIVGLLGPNGAGKTTTVKMIASLIEPTSGDIFIDGKNIRSDKKHALRKVAAVLESNRNIYWVLTPRQNIDFFANAWGFSTGSIRNYREELLEKFNLLEVADKPVMKLSRGMQQKVAVCCALIRKAPLLLLDEPTLGLDVMTTNELKNTLRDIAKNDGNAILLTSHNMKVVQDICDRVIIIKKGKIIADDKVSNLIDMFSANFFKVVFKNGNINFDFLNGIKVLKSYDQEENRAVEFELQDEDALYELLEVIRRSGGKLISIEKIQPDLEEVFIRFVAGG